MARPNTIKVDLSAIPVNGLELVNGGYRQKVRSFIQRWQDRFDTERQMRFEVKKVLQGYVVIRLK